jgi:hypothetical protein
MSNINPIDKFISDYVTDKMAEGMKSKVHGWSMSKIVEELPTFPTFPQWRAFAQYASGNGELTLKTMARREVLQRVGLS